MDNFPWFFMAVFAAIAGSILFRRMRYGSWTGAFLGASIQRTVGEVTLERKYMTSHTLNVYVMEGDDSSDRFVGLSLVSKAPMSAHLSPFKLTREQARQLATLLQQAAAP